MHKNKIISFCPTNFNTSLDELKDFLKFKLEFFEKNSDLKIINDEDILLCNEDFLIKNGFYEIIKNSKNTKILVGQSNKIASFNFERKITLPIKFDDFNTLIENVIVKKNFSKNSSIKVKLYRLDKNEKKIFKDKKYVQLTEKEIQLIELLSSKKTPISKEKILSEVWQYAEDADTHTVETHIYRLRKKIKSSFSDDKFIFNNEKGYLI